jgi:hypothetical protein
MSAAHLDVIDRMDVLHAILNYSAQFLQSLVATHAGNSVSLDQDIASGQQFQRLERASIRPQDSLSPLGKLLPIPHQAIDLDDIHRHAILQNLDRLGHRHRSRQQADQISCLQDSGRIPGLSGGLNGHGTLDQVQLAGNLFLLQRARHQRPGFPQVRLAVFGEFDLEVGFGLEGTAFGVFGFKLFDLVVA